MGRRSRSDRLSPSGSSIGDLGRRVGVALRAGLLYNPRSPFAPFLCIARSLVCVVALRLPPVGYYFLHHHLSPPYDTIRVPSNGTLVRELLAGPTLPYCHHYHTQREPSKGALETYI